MSAGLPADDRARRSGRSPGRGERRGGRGTSLREQGHGTWGDGQARALRLDPGKLPCACSPERLARIDQAGARPWLSPASVSAASVRLVREAAFEKRRVGSIPAAASNRDEGADRLAELLVMILRLQGKPLAAPELLDLAERAGVELVASSYSGRLRELKRALRSPASRELGISEQQGSFPSGPGRPPASRWRAAS